MAEELEFDLTLYPDPVLRRPATAVATFDGRLRDTLAAMFRRMYESRGVGLAAPQVALKSRILVVNAEGEPDPKHELVLINPVILELSGPDMIFEEGCLSFPGIFAEVQRPELCRVRAQDVEGKEFEATYDGFLSRVVQHEHDHLEGVLLVDRMSPADKLRHKAALEDLKVRYKRGVAKSRSRS